MGPAFKDQLHPRPCLGKAWLASVNKSFWETWTGFPCTSEVLDPGFIGFSFPGSSYSTFLANEFSKRQAALWVLGFKLRELRSFWVKYLMIGNQILQSLGRTLGLATETPRLGVL